MPESVTVGELLVRIRADVRDLEAGLRKGQQGFDSFSTRTRPGLRAVENAFRNITFAVAGVPGPVGRLASSLGHVIGQGVALTAGFLVAGAVIGTFVRRMGQVQEKATAAAKALRDIPKEAQIRLNLEQVEKGVTQLQHISTWLQGLLGGAAALGGPLGAAFGGILERLLGGAAKKLAEFSKATADGVRNIALAVKDAESASAPYFARWEQFDAQARVWARRNTITTLVGEQKEALLEAESALVKWEASWQRWDQQARQAAHQFRIDKILFEATGFAGTLPAGLQKTVDNLMAQLRTAVNAAKGDLELRETALAVGFTIGEYISGGVRAAMDKTFGEYLKAALKDAAARLISGAIFAGIGFLIGGPPGAAAGFAVGSGIPLPGKSAALQAPNLAGAGLMTINLGNMPAATNPLAATRDAQWQVFLKESLLVSRAGGFR